MPPTLPTSTSTAAMFTVLPRLQHLMSLELLDMPLNDRVPLELLRALTALSKLDTFRAVVYRRAGGHRPLPRNILQHMLLPAGGAQVQALTALELAASHNYGDDS